MAGVVQRSLGHVYDATDIGSVYLSAIWRSRSILVTEGLVEAFESWSRVHLARLSRSASSSPARNDILGLSRILVSNDNEA